MKLDRKIAANEESKREKSAEYRLVYFVVWVSMVVGKSFVSQQSNETFIAKRISTRRDTQIKWWIQEKRGTERKIDVK